MSIQITQTGGAGAAVADKGLSGAWLDVPITVTLSNVGMNAYEHTIEDQTTGLDVAIATGDARIATFTPSGNRGSFRIRSGYREQSYSPWRYTYRVIRVERDSTGANYAPASPALEETPSETAEDRGYAEKLDELFAGILSEIAVTEYASAVDLTSSRRMVYDGENSDVFLAGLSATSGFNPTAKIEWFVPAGTATSVAIAANVDPDGSLASLFDAAEDFTLFVTATSATTLVASAQSRPPLGTTIPTIVSATVAPVTLNQIALECSEASMLPVSASVPDGDITGLSLGGTMAVPRTITSVISGNGTTTPTLGLSGNLDLADEPTLVIASGRAFRAMNGPRFAVGSTAVEIGALSYDWTLETGDTLWLRGDTGIGVADEAVVPSWTGINPPNAYVFSEATNRPTFEIAAANGQPGIDCDGTNDTLTSASMTMANMFGSAATSFFITAAIQIDAVVSTTGDSISNDAIVSDNGSRFALCLTHEGGTYRVVCGIYDSALGYVTASYSLGASLPAGGEVVIHGRMSGGLLYAGANGTEGTGVACNGIHSVADSNLVRIGRGDSGYYFNGIIFEIAAKTNGTFPTAAIDAFVAKYVV